MNIPEMDKMVQLNRAALNERYWPLMRALERADIDILELARALKDLA